MKILIIRVSAIGDVIHTLPSLFLLKHLLPNAQIEWVVQAKAASLIADQKIIDRVHILPDDYLRPQHWRSFFKIIKTLKKTEWDAIIDYQGLIKTSAIILFLRGKKFGFSWDHARWAPSSWLTNHHDTPAYTNIIQKNLSLTSFVAHSLRPSTYQPSLLALANEFGLTCDAQKKSIVDAWITNINKPFIALCPNTTWESKHWPQGHWEKFLTDYSFQEMPVIVGSQYGAAAQNLKLFAEKKQITFIAMPKWDLITTAYALSKAALVIGPDTGLMHLVDFIGGQALTIFGPTNKDKHGPFIRPANKVRALQISCTHTYQKSHGKEFNCMAQLAPHELLLTVKNSLHTLSEKKDLL